MIKEIQGRYYLKEDISNFFDMGMDTALSIFEETIGMSPDEQRYILSRIKEMLMKERTAGVADHPFLKVVK